MIKILYYLYIYYVLEPPLQFSNLFAGFHELLSQRPSDRPHTEHIYVTPNVGTLAIIRIESNRTELLPPLPPSSLLTSRNRSYRVVMSGTGVDTTVPTSTDAELDRLADEALRADAEDAELDSLAAELLQENGNGVEPNGSPQSTKATTTPVRAPGAAGAAAASGMAAFNSLMSRARGMRFGTPTGAAAPPDPYAVLGTREAAIWRQVLANDSARPPVGPRALSRSYKCENRRVRALDDAAVAELAAEATREAATAIKAGTAEVAGFDKFARGMAGAFRAEIERALAARLATDPDFDAERFPNAAQRFAL